MSTNQVKFKKHYSDHVFLTWSEYGKWRFKVSRHGWQDPEYGRFKIGQGMADMDREYGRVSSFLFFLVVFFPVSLLPPVWLYSQSACSLTPVPIYIITRNQVGVVWGGWCNVQIHVKIQNKSCFKYLQHKVGTSGHKIDQLLKAEHKRCHFTQHKTLKKFCQ